MNVHTLYNDDETVSFTVVGDRVTVKTTSSSGRLISQAVYGRPRAREVYADLKRQGYAAP